jgi:hypothetical protein
VTDTVPWLAADLSQLTWVRDHDLGDTYHLVTFGLVNHTIWEYDYGRVEAVCGAGSLNRTAHVMWKPKDPRHPYRNDGHDYCTECMRQALLWHPQLASQ